MKRREGEREKGGGGGEGGGGREKRGVDRRTGENRGADSAGLHEG